VLFVLAGLWWQWEDWRNDLYEVTERAIIDIERKPLGFSSVRRETSLDRVQNVTSQQPGFWSNVLNYGTVVIQTAAADTGITFFMVSRPAQVQRIIFQRVDAYRRKLDERALSQRQRELIEGLQIYHEMRAERDQGRI
jgi:hypothetical protein